MSIDKINKVDKVNVVELNKQYRLDAKFTKVKYARGSFSESKLLVQIQVDGIDKIIELTYLNIDDNKYFIETACCLVTARVTFIIEQESDDKYFGKMLNVQPLGPRLNLKLTGRILDKHNIIRGYQVDCEGLTIHVSPDIIKNAIRIGNKNVENVGLGLLSLKGKNGFKFESLPVVEDRFFV